MYTDLYGFSAGLRPVVIAPPVGGQLMGKGVDVENYPGLLDMTGPGIVHLMRKQALSFNTAFDGACTGDRATSLKTMPVPCLC